MVTYRVCGRDFTGGSDTLVAWDAARSYARRQLETGDQEGVSIFLVGTGCLPVVMERVIR